MTTLKAGIASYEDMKARTLAISRTPSVAYDKVQLDLPLST